MLFIMTVLGIVLALLGYDSESLRIEKKYLTTPPTRGMIISTEPMFYSHGARAAARAQRGSLHEGSCLPACDIRALSIGRQPVMPFTLHALRFPFTFHV